MNLLLIIAQQLSSFRLVALSEKIVGPHTSFVQPLCGRRLSSGGMMRIDLEHWARKSNPLFHREGRLIQIHVVVSKMQKHQLSRVLRWPI